MFGGDEGDEEVQSGRGFFRSPVGKITGLAFTAVFSIVLLISLFWMFEGIDAGEVVVIQSPGGSLTWYTTPGIKWQGFGKVTRYHKRAQYEFFMNDDPKQSKALKIRFNDGAHADISGSIAWEMPLDEEHLNDIHSRYGSQEAVQQQLIKTVVDKAVYMTGPLMTSKESYAEKRPMLLNYFEDQIQNGVYMTVTVQEKQIDSLTNSEKLVNVVQIVKAQDGTSRRTEESPLHTFGIKAFNPSINEVRYTKEVDDQIQTQQKAAMDVITAIAQAKKADQDAITAERNGQANAATAKWEQEVEKARAKVKVETAELYKQEQILRGEGDAAYRRALMTADGALDKKLEAYLKATEMYTNAMAKYPGNWVPSIVMGGGNGGNSNGALNLMDFLTAKTANDLGLSLKNQTGNQTQK